MSTFFVHKSGANILQKEKILQQILRVFKNFNIYFYTLFYIFFSEIKFVQVFIRNTTVNRIHRRSIRAKTSKDNIVKKNIRRPSKKLMKYFNVDTFQYFLLFHLYDLSSLNRLIDFRYGHL